MPDYEVVWRVSVTAKDAQDAAQQARAVMIDPARTRATFEVRLLRFLEPLIVIAQDPDRSDE